MPDPRLPGARMTRTQLEALARSTAVRIGIPPAGFLAQIRQESAWNPNAVNTSSGAMGLGQFMPATWAEWGQGKSPFDPAASLESAARYMKWIRQWLIGQGLDGSWDQALASYNWGIGNVRTAVGTYGDEWLEHTPAETRQYVYKIGPAYRASSVDAKPLLIAVVAGAVLWGLA